MQPGSWSNALDVSTDVVDVLGKVLNLGSRSESLRLHSPLLGSIPELDSMAVVGVITALEERFGFTVEDDEIDGATFATVGTVVAFVEGKLRGQ
jgi:acyl carrier protein